MSSWRLQTLTTLSEPLRPHDGWVHRTRLVLLPRSVEPEDELEGEIRFRALGTHAASTRAIGTKSRPSLQHSQRPARAVNSSTSRSPRSGWRRPSAVPKLPETGLAPAHPVADEVHGHRQPRGEEGCNSPGRRVLTAVPACVREYASGDRGSNGECDKEGDGVKCTQDGDDTCRF